MEVVASFRGTSLADSTNESVQYLKRYLEYAENGPSILARDVLQTDAEPDSPFEESVLAVLSDWGYQVQPQVGVAGYRIDLGLRHPELPGAYALGIECDGAMYHSSKAARDRDRLREQVLNGLGWRLYRIWGTDWYRGRAAAELRLREAVEQAIAQGPLAASGPAARAAATPGDLPEAGSADGAGALPTVPAPRAEEQGEVEIAYARVPVDIEVEREWSAPYRTAMVSVTLSYELHTVEARPALRKALAQIIEAEGPVHEDVLVQRAREAWGLGRAGNRIRDNVREVAQALVRSGLVACEGSFFDVAERAEGLKARRPEDGEVPRKVTYIAPAERHLALCELAVECPGMSEEELIKQACDFFGWRRMGKDIRDCLAADIGELHRQRRLEGGPERVGAVR